MYTITIVSLLHGINATKLFSLLTGACEILILAVGGKINRKRFAKKRGKHVKKEIK